METPTGFGKSPLNVAFCRILPSFYITPQLVLIKQLSRDFPDLVPIKGRRHYHCAEVLMGNCAEDAPCKKDSDYMCHNKYTRCLYWVAKIRAIESQTVLTNFAYFVGEGFLHDTNVPHFGDRELLVIDEGHDVDQHILDNISITVGTRTLPYSVFQKVKKIISELPKRLTKEQIDNLLSRTALQCKFFLDELPEILSDRDVIDKDKSQRFIRKVKNYQKNQDTEDWVGQTQKKVYKKGVWVEAKIQPIYARSFMYDHLWKRANRFIISSATIFANDFIKECGLANHEEEVWHVEAPSTFPIQNRMIVDATVGSMSWSKRKETTPAAVAAVRKILTIEKGKGLIHAHSYRFAEAIKNGVPDQRLLFHESDSRQDILDEFLKSPPETGRVLVAVAMTEGLDLVGDKATFQILLKCPYANYKEDLRIKRRLLELRHNRWYNVRTLKTIIQAYGRAVRSPTDRAAFYILDSDVNRICKQWRRQLPKFFREAYDARERLT